MKQKFFLFNYLIYLSSSRNWHGAGTAKQTAEGRLAPARDHH